MSPSATQPDPLAARIDEKGVERLFEAVAKEVARAPACAAQVAVARHGKLGAFGCFGRAPFEAGEREAGPDTLFSVFSVTKALTASAVWLLLAEGRLALDQKVAAWIPAFEKHGKQEVSVEHLLTHTAGFPDAPFETLDWNDADLRLARFDTWRLEWPPGSRFVYHGSSGMWVLAELIERASGQDFRQLIRDRITGPLGLDLHLGLPASEHGRVAEMVPLGEPASATDGAPSPVDAPVLPDEMYERFNSFDVQAVGNPGGGAIGTAAAVAMFYQAILADWRGSDGPGIWSRAGLEDAFRIRFPDLIDPMTKQPALRGLGVVMAGDEGAIWRGFSPHCSARSIGHMGAGGQIAWADPDSGLSFSYLTNGAERDAVRQGGRGLKLSILASKCLA